MRTSLVNTPAVSRFLSASLLAALTLTPLALRSADAPAPQGGAAVAPQGGVLVAPAGLPPGGPGARGGGGGGRGGRGGPPLPPPNPAVFAPVEIPAAVAIPRPTEAELKQTQAELDRLLTQASPTTKALVAKFPGLISVTPPRANVTTAPNLNPGYAAQHIANVEIAKKGDIDVLFMGDSITDWWRQPGPQRGAAVFAKEWGHLKTANFGIAGDTTQGVLYRLRDGEGEGFTPKAIMLMIGTNSAGGSTSAEIAEGVGAVVADMRKRWPAAKILLLGIFPRADPGSALRNTVNGVNPIIAKLHDGKNVFYLDIGAKFLDADGNLPADIMPDKLHPTEKGYQIWADAVREPFNALIGPSATVNVGTPTVVPAAK